MGGEDVTKNLRDDSERTTQPTITAVFELVREVKQAVDNNSVRQDETNARLDATNARLDDIEARLAGDIAALDKRVVDGFKDLGTKMNLLNKRVLQAEADAEIALERTDRMGPKAS